MVHLGKSNFVYRSDWGTAPSGQHWDVTQVYNNTIYLDGPGLVATVGKETLAQVQAHGGDKGRFASSFCPIHPPVVERRERDCARTAAGE